MFQRRCLDRIRQFQQEGRTIVVVTHAADLVRQVCDRAIVLKDGGILVETSVEQGLAIVGDVTGGERRTRRKEDDDDDVDEDEI